MSEIKILNIAPWDSIWSMDKGGAPDEYYYYKAIKERGWKSYFTTIERSGNYLKFKPDLVVAHSAFSTLVAKLISIKLKIPMIAKFYGSFIADKPNDKSSQEYMGWLKKADYYIFINDGTKLDKVAKRFDITNYYFSVNGVPKELYDKPYDQDKLKKELNIIDDRPVVLSASRLIDWKRPDRVVGLAIKHPELKFIHIGDGPLKEWSNAYRGEVEFRGSVPYTEVHKYIKACDAFLSVSDLSNLSNGTLEAIAANKRLFTFDNGVRQILKKYPLAPYPYIDEISYLMRNFNKHPKAKAELKDWSQRTKEELDIFEQVINDYHKSS